MPKPKTYRRVAPLVQAVRVPNAMTPADLQELEDWVADPVKLRAVLLHLRPGCYVVKNWRGDFSVEAPNIFEGIHEEVAVSPTPEGSPV